MVQVYVSQLRKALAGSGNGAEIVTRGRGYELRLGSGDLDVRRFERLVAEGAPREALALWRGPPLDDVAGEPFAAARDPPARGAAARGDRAGDRAGPRRGPAPRGHRRARGAGGRGAAARAAARPADAGAVSLRPPGRRAGRLPPGARRRSSTRSASSRGRSCGACTRRSCARTRRSTCPRRSRSSCRRSSTPGHRWSGARPSWTHCASTGGTPTRRRPDLS